MERKIVKKIEVDRPIELKFSDGNAHDVLLYAEREALGEIERNKRQRENQQSSLSENDDDGTIELVETVEEDSDKRIKRKVETKRTVSEDPSTKSRVTKVTKTETTEVTKVYVLKTDKDVEKARQELGVADVSSFVKADDDSLFEIKSEWSQPKIQMQHENEVVTPLDLKRYSLGEPALSKESVKKSKVLTDTSKTSFTEPKISGLEEKELAVTSPAMEPQLDEHVYPIPAVQFDQIERKKKKGKEAVSKKRKSPGLCTCARRSKSKESDGETRAAAAPLSVERKGSIRGVSAEHGKLSPALKRHVFVKSQSVVSDELKTVIRDNNMQLTNYLFDLMCKIGVYKTDKEQDRGRKVISRCLDILYYDRAKTWDDVRNQIWYENKEYEDTNHILMPTVNVIEHALTKEGDLNKLMNSPVDIYKLEAFTEVALKPTDLRSEEPEHETGKFKILHEPMEKAASVYHSVKRKFSAVSHPESVEETGTEAVSIRKEDEKVSDSSENISSIINAHKSFVSVKPSDIFKPDVAQRRNELTYSGVETVAVKSPAAAEKATAGQTDNLVFIMKEVDTAAGQKQDVPSKVSDDHKKSKGMFHCFGTKSGKAAKPKVAKVKAEHAAKKKPVTSGKTCDRVIEAVEPPAVLLPSIKASDINYNAPQIDFKSLKTGIETAEKELLEGYEIRPLIDSFTVDTSEISPTAIDVSKKVLTSSDSVTVEEESKIRSHKPDLSSNDDYVTVRRSEHINVSTSGHITASDLEVKTAKIQPSVSVRIKDGKATEVGEIKSIIQTHKGSVKKTHPYLDDMKHIGQFYRTDFDRPERVISEGEKTKDISQEADQTVKEGMKPYIDIAEKTSKSLVSSEIFSQPISEIATRADQGTSEIQEIIAQHGKPMFFDDSDRRTRELCDIIKSHESPPCHITPSSHEEVSKIISSHKDFDSIKTVVVPLPGQEPRVPETSDEKKTLSPTPKPMHTSRSCFTCFAPKAKKVEEATTKKAKVKAKSEELVKDQTDGGAFVDKREKQVLTREGDVSGGTEPVVLPDIVLKPSAQLKEKEPRSHLEDKDLEEAYAFGDRGPTDHYERTAAPILHGAAKSDYESAEKEKAIPIKIPQQPPPPSQPQLQQQHHVLDAPRIHLPDLNAYLDFQNILFKPGVLTPFRSKLCQVFDTCDPTEIDAVLSETRDYLGSEASVSLKSRLSSRLYPPLVETAVSVINAIYSDYRSGLITQEEVPDKLVSELEKYIVEPRSSIDADTLSSDRPVEKLAARAIKTEPEIEQQQEVSKQVVITKGKCFSCATEKKVPIVLSPDCIQILENLQSIPPARFQRTSSQISDRIAAKWKFDPQYEKELQKIVKKALTKLKDGQSVSLSVLRNELKNEHKKNFFLVDPVVDVIRVLSERTDFAHPIDSDMLDKVVSDVKHLYTHLGPLTEGECNLVTEQLPDLVESTGRRLVAADETLTKKKKKLSRIIIDAYDMLSKRQVATLNDLRCQLYRMHPKDRGLVDVIVDDIDSSLREGRFYKSQSVRILINIIHTKDIESCLIQNGSQKESLLTERAYNNLLTYRPQIIRTISRVIRENANDNIRNDSGLDQIIDDALKNLETCTSFENLLVTLATHYPHKKLVAETICNVVEQCYFASEFENVDQHEIVALMKDRIDGKPLVLREICFTLPARTEIKTGATGDFGSGKIVHIGRGLSWREANERARILFYKGRQSSVRYNDSLDGFDVKMLLEQNGVVQEVPVSKEDVRRLLNSCGLYWDGLNISLLGKSDEILRKAEQEAFKILRDSGFLYEHDSDAKKTS